MVLEKPTVTVQRNQPQSLPIGRIRCETEQMAPVNLGLAKQTFLVPYSPCRRQWGIGDAPVVAVQYVLCGRIQPWQYSLIPV